jgi:small subunit ribosomal protein S17
VATVKGTYGGRKIREGTVVSDKMEKTVLVRIESRVPHPLYKKMVRRVRKFMAHDPEEQAKVGDRVRIVESSPVSRRKRWRLVEIIERVELPEVAAESIDLELLGEVKRPDEEPAARAAVAAASAPETEAAAPRPVPAAEAEPEAAPGQAAVIQTAAAPQAPAPAESGAGPEEEGAVQESSAALEATAPPAPAQAPAEPSAVTVEDAAPAEAADPETGGAGEDAAAPAEAEEEKG